MNGIYHEVEVRRFEDGLVLDEDIFGPLALLNHRCAGVELRTAAAGCQVCCLRVASLFLYYQICQLQLVVITVFIVVFVVV